MSSETHLVKRGELEGFISSMISKEKSLIDDISKILPAITDESLTKQLTRKKKQSEEHLKALEEGYVPVDGGWFWDVETKSKWGKRAVKEILDTMPEEVKEVMEQEKASGTFSSVKVSGSRRGDPMLVGKAGRKNFLLAMWCNFEGGTAVGFVCRGRRHNG